MTPDEFEDTLDATTYAELCTEISDGYMGETGDLVRDHARAVLALREARQQPGLLSDTFLAERDLDPKYFRRIRGRRRNPDYNDGYRMGMEDAARYARGDFTPTGKDLEGRIEGNLSMLPSA